jgi:hypothetical protein
MTKFMVQVIVLLEGPQLWTVQGMKQDFRRAELAMIVTVALLIVSVSSWVQESEYVLHACGPREYPRVPSIIFNLFWKNLIRQNSFRFSHYLTCSRTDLNTVYDILLKHTEHCANMIYFWLSHPVTVRATKHTDFEWRKYWKPTVVYVNELTSVICSIKQTQIVKIAMQLIRKPNHNFYQHRK